MNEEEVIIEPEVEKKLNPNEKSWAIAVHLLAFVTFIGIPLGNILGPLILWLIKKGDMPLVDEQGKSALNFQISMTIYAVISFFLIFAFVGIVLLPIVIIMDIICTIIAAVKVNNGEPYSYPLSIHFLK